MICKDCKEDKPRGGKGLCRTCYSRHWYRTCHAKALATRRRYQKDNREQCNETSRKWRQRNPEKHTASVRKSEQKNPKQHKIRTTTYETKRKLSKRDKKLQSDLDGYGISRAFYNLCLDKGCCICQEKFQKTPHLDHCYTTGKFRGVLCGLCNKMLGHARDSTNTLTRAIQYIGI